VNCPQQREVNRSHRSGTEIAHENCLRFNSFAVLNSGDARAVSAIRPVNSTSGNAGTVSVK